MVAKRYTLKIDFNSKNFVVELENGLKELYRVDIQIDFADVKSMEVKKENNLLVLEAINYNVARKTARLLDARQNDGGSFEQEFVWDNIELRDILEREAEIEGNIVLNVPLMLDICNRGLDQRRDVLDRLKQEFTQVARNNSNPLTVDGLPYSRPSILSGTNNQKCEMQTAREFGPQSKSDAPIGQPLPPKEAHEGLERASEDKIFDDNFSTKDLNDFKNLESNEISNINLTQ